MARRQRPVKVRRLWRMNPRTRVKPSAKRYRRAKIKREIFTAFKEEDIAS